jgi:hypothetical protein
LRTMVMLPSQPASARSSGRRQSQATRQSYAERIDQREGMAPAVEPRRPSSSAERPRARRTMIATQRVRLALIISTCARQQRQRTRGLFR